MFTYQLDEKTSLKILGFEDAEALHQLTEANRAHLRRWLPWVDHSKTKEDTEGFIKMTLEQLPARRGIQAGVWYDGNIAGVVGHNQVNSSHRQCGIGYWLGEAYEGKGLMTKACMALFDYSFNIMNLNRIEIRCGEGNHKSRKIPERLGCKNEGTLRQAELLPSGFHDIVVYSMIKADWQNSQVS